MEVSKKFALALALLGVVSTSRSSRADGPTPAPSVQPCYDPVAQYRLGVWTIPITYFEPALNSQVRGLFISNLEFRGPAHRAGIERRDIIVRVNGTLVGNLDELKEALNVSGGEATIRIRNWRTGRYVDVPAFALDPSVSFNEPTPDQIP